MTTSNNAQPPQTCTCGKPSEPGTHRIDGPCYVSANPAPAETATPLNRPTEYIERFDAMPVSPAGKLARYILTLESQLKSMTDQFLAVSGQLGEAHEVIKELMVVGDGPSDVNATKELCDRREAAVERGHKIISKLRKFSHLAQSDSPGAGVKGEGL